MYMWPNSGQAVITHTVWQRWILNCLFIRGRCKCEYSIAASLAYNARYEYSIAVFHADKKPQNTFAQATALLAAEETLRCRGITACAVCPGSCLSDMNPMGRDDASTGAAAVVWAVNHTNPNELNGKLWMRGCEIPTWTHHVPVMVGYYVNY
jgi:hypothetical protein